MGTAPDIVRGKVSPRDAADLPTPNPVLARRSRTKEPCAAIVRDGESAQETGGGNWQRPRPANSPMSSVRPGQHPKRRAKRTTVRSGSRQARGHWLADGSVRELCPGASITHCLGDSRRVCLLFKGGASCAPPPPPTKRQSFELGRSMWPSTRTSDQKNEASKRLSCRICRDRRGYFGESFQANRGRPQRAARRWKIRLAAPVRTRAQSSG